jgi:hypothetical protein
MPIENCEQIIEALDMHHYFFASQPQQSGLVIRSQNKATLRSLLRQKRCSILCSPNLVTI